MDPALPLAISWLPHATQNSRPAQNPPDSKMSPVDHKIKKVAGIIKCIFTCTPILAFNIIFTAASGPVCLYAAGAGAVVGVAFGTLNYFVGKKF